ncbi:hypothetical protein JVU11DRAFT_10637 [Chiua virens]|nr:hypothetical protein JVU11DRAFT_10637 [Chiua virens]
MPAARLPARSPSPLPVLPIVPVVPEIPSVDVVYHPCIVAQRTSTDLVIYTRDLGRIITIAYPLGPHGARIVPSGVFHWMERRGLVFECFCALVSSQLTPARFVDEFISRHTVVRCHYADNHCGFYLDLTRIYLMTLYESPYEYLPTLTFGVPNINSILARWRRLVTGDPTLLQHPAPFVRGYFSVHVSVYPGIHQLRSGLSRPLILATPHRRYHPYNGHASQSPINVIALHRSTPYQLPRRRMSNRNSRAEVPGPSRLGLAGHQTDDFFEQCDHCGESFTQSALRVHIKEVGEQQDDMAGNDEVNATNDTELL